MTFNENSPGTQSIVIIIHSVYTSNAFIDARIDQPFELQVICILENLNVFAPVFPE